MRTLIALSLALFASACNVVTSEGPLGTSVMTLEPTEWDGVWLHGEGTVTVKVTDADAGRLVLVYLDEHADSLEPVTTHVQLRRHDGWTFANMRHEEVPSSNRWFRIQREENQLIAWLPTPDLVAAAVRDGHLPGKIDEHGNVHLEELTLEELELITDSTRGILIDWEQPIAFIRISDDPGA